MRSKDQMNIQNQSEKGAQMKSQMKQMNRETIVTVIIAIAVLASLFVPAANAAALSTANADRVAAEQKTKVAADLQARLERAPARRLESVIVTYASAPVASDVQKLRSRGHLDRPLRSVNGVAARLSRKAIADLSRDP